MHVKPMIAGGLRTIVVAIALTAGALRVSAQQVASSSSTKPVASASGFIGAIVDSIHGGPLVGVEVSVVGTERGARSDSRGRFRIDSVPAGVYRLAISHPLFDTLGLSPTTQQITVTPNHYVVVALGTPSARTLRRELCPTADTTATPSFIMGRVRDADTGRPAAGAHISMEYSTTAVTLAAGVRRDTRVRRAVADAEGTYVICGLESDLRGTLQAESAGVTTGEVETSLDGKVIALRSLSTGFAEIGEVSVRATTAGTPRDSSLVAPDYAAATMQRVQRMQRGRASVTGFVLDPAGLPLVGVIVAVTSTAATARTGPNGEFTLVDLPSGTQELAVRYVGFDPTMLPIELSSRATQSVTIRLQRAPSSLPPVVVTSKTNAALIRLGFFDRQKASAGFFITPDEVAKAQPHVVTDLMYLVPGWQVQTNSSGLTVLLPPRSAFAEGKSSCINVFVDHALLNRLAPGEFDSAIPARDVVAVEVYSRSTVPAEFARALQSCVTIVVWTRARVEK
jgi:hypothetical protein